MKEVFWKFCFWAAGFFEEGSKQSSMRAIFIIGQIFSMAMGIAVWCWTHDYMALATGVGMMSATFGLQKIWQNRQENNAEDNKNKTNASAAVDK